MSEETLKIIEQLASSVGSNSAYIIEKYSHWHMVSAFVWIVIGVMAMIAAFKTPFPDDWDEIPRGIAKTVLFIVGALILGGNIPDLMVPDGVAIHQLIKDIAGR